MFAARLGFCMAKQLNNCFLHGNELLGVLKFMGDKKSPFLLSV
jgi:hypothetical protein